MNELKNIEEELSLICSMVNLNFKINNIINIEEELDLILRIESFYNIDLNDSDLLLIKTFRDLIDLINITSNK